MSFWYFLRLVSPGMGQDVMLTYLQPIGKLSIWKRYSCTLKGNRYMHKPLTELSIGAKKTFSSVIHGSEKGLDFHSPT